MFAVAILGTTTILLIISLVSVYMSQKSHFELEHNENSTARNDKQHPSQQQQQQHQPFDGKCSQTVTISNKTRDKNYCLTPDCVKVAASVIEAIDLTVDPCDDFYVSSEHLVPPS